jgi:LCP family protein required for cell wall assembly
VLLAVIVLGSALGYGAYYFNSVIQQPLDSIIHPVSRLPGEKGVVPSDVGTNVTGRSWNILLLGSDNDNKYTFPDVLTQVMMIVHIDTVQNTVSMVSIPRDSWVYDPSSGGMHKIDQIFELGASKSHTFDGGVQAARYAVEQDYGITIDRYAWVGLNGFANVINTLGGLDIDVLHPIVDDTYPLDTGNSSDPYAYQRLYIPVGPQHLDGTQALDYVRTRHADLVGDIGRTIRQQQVLTALKLKLNASNVLSNLPQLFQDVKGSIYTDMSEGELIGFANYGRSLHTSGIQSVTLGPGPGLQDYGNTQTIYDPSIGSNQDVIIPNCANIQLVVNHIFELGTSQTCNVTGS